MHHQQQQPQGIDTYTIRPAQPHDCDGARSVMLDTFYREFDYGYVPAWHPDVIDIQGTYLDNPRHQLIVALSHDEVVATAGLLSRGPAASTASTMAGGALRLRGAARTHLCPARAQAPWTGPRHGAEGMRIRRRHGGYDCVYLHTNVNIPGAQGFWNSIAKEVFDARTTGEHGAGFGTVHFEIPLPG